MDVAQRGGDPGDLAAVEIGLHGSGIGGSGQAGLDLPGDIPFLCKIPQQAEEAGIVDAALVHHGQDRPMQGDADPIRAIAVRRVCGAGAL